mmetsp:Transcript_32108/g.74821  ORF Transcript_32108/g.74821 Transcript_32108/m.74821 type:complete len:220 (-) Transcript_32108:256-915(-)|eukprot:CAMPEP_0119364664 /NCGR_PEP_ID=MMETSP1334-20130426/11577_1 /TAXON_ID=127549 /ORGANISM="Calcidiscus leptoporus, Strain RCC1130" /LENGTH=219 /DNA_ID=CAMNT_0007380423 /DNA_START=30 /DNA_END=689 /DNA_ORIENTATION=+
MAAIFLHALGWTGAAFYLMTPLMPNKRRLAQCSLCSSLSYCGHFALLSGPLSGGALNMLLGALNAHSSICSWGGPVRKYLWLALVPVVACSTSGWDLLPHASMIISLIAFQCDDEPLLRLLTGIGSLPWCPYAYHAGSRSTLVACILYSCLQCMQAWRFRRRQMGQKEQRVGYNHWCAVLCNRRRWILSVGECRLRHMRMLTSSKGGIVSYSGNATIAV